MRTKTVLLGIVLPGISCAAAMAFGAGIGGSALSGGGAAVGSPHAAENSRLRSALSTAEKKLAILEEEARIRGGTAKRTKEAAMPIALTGKKTAAQKTALYAELDARLAALTTEIQVARDKGPQLTPEQVAKTIAELKLRLGEAISTKDREAAINILAELARLGEGAFPDLVTAWAKLKDAGVIGGFGRGRGMGGMRDTMAWGSKDVFNWALSTSSLGVEGGVARKFQAIAVFSLRMFESDRDVRNKTYVSFLYKQNPVPLTPEQLSATSRREQFRIALEDPYRGALMSISRRPTSETLPYLTGVAGNAELPSDVRVTALNGLARDPSPEAQKAVQDAAYDQDPAVKQASAMAQIKSNPPATGYLIESVSADSQASQLGFKAGDIITTYNKVAIQGGRDLMMLPRQVTTETAPMTVYQGGKLSTFDMNPQKPIGINGSFVRVPAAPSSDK